MITLHPGTSYHPQTAAWMARFCEVAYDDEAAGQRFFAEHGWNYRFFDRGGCQCYLACDDDSAVLVYRGTEPRKLIDWATDLQFCQRPGPFGVGDRVHSGFNRYVDRTWRAVIKALPDFAGPDRTLYLGGHSLGAAAATIAAARLTVGDGLPTDGTTCFRRLGGLYLFGSPRPGNAGFAMLADHLVGRMAGIHWHANNNDVITRVPWMLGLYRHVGRQARFHFSRHGSRWKNPTWWRWLWDRYGGLRRGLLHWGTDGFADHRIREYVRLTRDHQHTPDAAESSPKHPTRSNQRKAA